MICTYLHVHDYTVKRSLILNNLMDYEFDLFVIPCNPWIDGVVLPNFSPSILI